MKGLNIPERFTGRIYISFHSDPHSCLYGTMSLHEHDFSDSKGRIQVGYVDVDIPLSAEGSLDKQVAQLRQAKQEIIDEATRKASELDEAIESLLAIEHTEAES